MFIHHVSEFFLLFFQHPLTQIALTLVIAVVVQLVIRRTIKRIVRRMVRSHNYTNPTDEKKREHTLSTIFRTASAVAIWITAVILVLWQLNVNLAALMTGAGVVGIVVGFGAQSAIRDFLAGIFIIVENQYRVGDIITLYAGGQSVAGTVEDISIRITRLRDLDGNLHIVQNGESRLVTNLSFDYANVNIDIGVAYNSDVDKVEEVMNSVGKTMAEDSKWSPHIREPIQFFRVDEFDESAVRIKALGKVAPAMQWELAGEYRRRIIKAFEQHNIEIPLPQRIIRTIK